MIDQAPGVSIGDLLRAHHDDTGRSYAEIARRCGISRALVYQLLRERGQVSKPATVRGLASGLGLPLLTVRRAALVTARIAVADGDDARSSVRAITDRLRELSDADLGLVAALVDAVAQHRA